MHSIIVHSPGRGRSGADRRETFLPERALPVRRLVALVTLILAGALPATASAATAKPRVIGGSAIPIQSAPWSVFLAIDNPSASCSGSVLDAGHVLTAAHCVIPEGTTRQRQPSEIHVLAGASDVHTWAPGQPAPSGAQAREVSAVRVHPYYDGVSKSDDAAVLTLSQPLSLSTPQVKPIPLAPVGPSPAPGTPVQTIGYGQQANGQLPDGKLYAATLGVIADDACSNLIGGNSAIMVCASSPSAASCHGDSGSALVAGSTEVAIFIGLVDPCGTAPGVYIDVAAPEVRSFIDGAPSIPIAPRQSTVAVLNALLAPVNGSRMTCDPGTWSGAPSFTYLFETDSPAPQVLQSGPSNVFAPPRAAVGQRIVCMVLAANAGGTGSARSGTTPPIAADTVGPVWRLASRRCPHRRCRLHLQARDPNSNSPLAIAVTANYRVAVRCGKHHRRRCHRPRSRALSVKATGGIDYRATSRRLPRTRVSFTIRVTDAGGNRRVRKGQAPIRLR
jgi:hypothetical protein